MRIRELGLSDLDDFLALRMEFLLSYNEIPSRQAFEKKTKQYLQEHLEKRDLMVLAAEEKGEIVSACLVNFYDTVPSVENASGKYAELRNVYTKPLYRRRGISEKLVQTSMEMAKKRGAEIMRLHYTEDGLPLYLKLGFVPEGKYMEKNL